MAWRDARSNFRRLFLFIASLVTGIAAVVAISSLNRSMRSGLDANARELLGADFVVNGNRTFRGDVKTAFDSSGLPQATEADMASMVLFRHNNQSRLIRLVAIDGPFPFYGEVVTQPASAYDSMKTGRYAILDESLASQYEVSSGDSVKIGNIVLPVAGIVLRIPGGGGIQATFTPSVYIAMGRLDATGLVQFGSRVNYKQFFKTDSEQQAEAQTQKWRPMLRRHGLSFDTVAERREELGEGFQSVYRFFSLLAFVALVLGCIGVASSVHLYAREKRDEVAVLRCIGSSGWQAFNIYFLQIFLLGIAASVLGVALGVVIQQGAPLFFGTYLPADIEFGISWLAIGEGLVLGGLVSFLFSFLPLIAVRFVPPLAVLRADFQPASFLSKSKAAAVLGIAIFPVAVSSLQTGSLLTGIAFSAGLAAALGCLTLVAMGLLWIVRRFFPSRAGFLWRHALANLFRPNNQTRILLVTIGLGGFIIATLNIVQSSLLGQVEFQGSSNKSNTILFDIQPVQKEGVEGLLEEHKLPVLQMVPIVTCRISELKGRAVNDYLEDPDRPVPGWAVTREYRVTYRDSLTASEELIEGGKLQEKRPGRDSVFVTISEGMHLTLNVTIGDSLVFDVQGVPVKAWISGIRDVDWPEDPPNFIFVFPNGILEQAPQTYVATTRIDAQETANRFQQSLVNGFPNVSLIDLRLILSTVNDLFEKIGLVVRFLALFSIVTGLVVLAGAVVNSRFARIREYVLLRTIGARTRQISRITLIEYAYVGVFSAVTGMALSLGGGFLLTRYFFEVGFSFDAGELAMIGGAVVVLTVFIGWFNSREVIGTPPLQVLRKET
jgi:putative ABC transport system permease protein